MKKKTIFSISGMHCASCVQRIEAAVKRLPGVLGAQINLVTGTAIVEYDSAAADETIIMRTISDLGYAVLAAASRDDPARYLAKQRKEVFVLRNKVIIAISLSCLLMYTSMAVHRHWPLPAVIRTHLAVFEFLVASVAVIIGGQFFTRGLGVLFRRKAPTMDTLIALGVGAAFVYSVAVSLMGPAAFGGKGQHVYYEIAAFLIAFILLGRFLEAKARRGTQDALHALIRLQPQTATVDRNGKETIVSVDDVQKGDSVLVLPGQRIPVDGIVSSGYSAVDESMLTGESVPVAKQPSDTVLAGSFNKTGSFYFTATNVGKDTYVHRIIALVEEASASKAPIQEITDAIAAYFVPVVLVIALAALAVWLLLTGDLPFALGIAITVLVISCPCSLGLAIPTAVVVATGVGARNGILFRNARSLQGFHAVDTIVFDKTGTLTVGRPAISDIVALDRPDGDVIAAAAALERHSEHPLAESVLDYAREYALKVGEAEDFQAYPGKGVMGRVNGKEITVGNIHFFEERKISAGPLAPHIQKFEQEAKTVLLVAESGTPIGIIAAIDTLKPYASSIVQWFTRRGIQVAMITGDADATSRRIAAQAGIVNVFSRMKPEDKVAYVKDAENGGKKVAMVGDGINDAASLAQASVAIAVATGTDVAVEAGDIVLIRDDLRLLVTAFRISRYTMRKIKQNLFWAFFYNAVSIPVAAGVLYPLTGFLLNPMIAGMAMTASSLSVVANSLLMKRFSGKTESVSADTKEVRDGSTDST